MYFQCTYTSLIQTRNGLLLCRFIYSSADLRTLSGISDFARKHPENKTFYDCFLAITGRLHILSEIYPSKSECIHPGFYQNFYLFSARIDLFWMSYSVIAMSKNCISLLVSYKSFYWLFVPLSSASHDFFCFTGMTVGKCTQDVGLCFHKID